MTTEEAKVSEHSVSAEAVIIDRDKERSLYLVQHVGTFNSEGTEYDLTTNGATVFIIERDRHLEGKPRLCVHVDIRSALNAALKLLIAEEYKS